MDQEQSESEGAADMKLYGLTLFLCTAWDWVVEECERGEGV